MDERKPQLVGKALAPSLDGLEIAVDREHASLSTQGLEYACRVTAAPERRIDIVTTRFEAQRRQRLVGEHGRMSASVPTTNRRGVKTALVSYRLFAGQVPLPGTRHPFVFIPRQGRAALQRQRIEQ